MTGWYFQRKEWKPGKLQNIPSAGKNETKNVRSTKKEQVWLKIGIRFDFSRCTDEAPDLVSLLHTIWSAARLSGSFNFFRRLHDFK